MKVEEEPKKPPNNYRRRVGLGKRGREKELCSRWEGLGKEIKAGGTIEEETS